MLTGLKHTVKSTWVPPIGTRKEVPKSFISLPYLSRERLLGTMIFVWRPLFLNSLFKAKTCSFTPPGLAKLCKGKKPIFKFFFSLNIFHPQNFAKANPDRRSLRSCAISLRAAPEQSSVLGRIG